MPGNRGSVDAEFTGDAAPGPATLMECTDAVDESHFELMSHDEPPLAPGAQGSVDQAVQPPQNGWFSSAHYWLHLGAR
jgi:hypothetical protein